MGLNFANSPFHNASLVVIGSGRVIRVLHIIIGLDVGGAELMLKRLIESHHGINNLEYKHAVISLTEIGKVGLQLQASGVDVESLGLRSLLSVPHVLWKLTKFIRESSPDIVQTWMYHADLLGGLSARLAGIGNIIWGIRCSGLPHSRMSPTQIIVSVCAWLSKYLPKVIVCCAKSACDVHIIRGYKPSKMLVIPNGYDLSKFTRSPVLSQSARIAFGCLDDDLVIGMVGRFDRQKDHLNFIHAATLLSAKVPRVKFLMIGRDLDTSNVLLQGWLSESGVTHNFVLAGERSDIPACLSAMDIFCLSSSTGEGFPNVVCEAMLMGVPCVVTDVGDAAEIVGDAGIVVQPRDSLALASALQSMIDLGVRERARLGELGRFQIEKNYSIEAVSGRFGSLYRELCGGLSLT